jgi:hypothetical protein
MEERLRFVARLLDGEKMALIEDPLVIQKILAHLDDRVSPVGMSLLPECRAPPATGLFD